MYRDLDFNGPLNDDRATRLIHSLGPLKNLHVTDVGCGWAELLLRTLATEPTTTGFGIDLSQDYIRFGRTNAESRGLADRVELMAGDVSAWKGEPSDIVFNVGSTHVWGGDPLTHTANALEALADLVRPGGRALFGECFWKRPPSDAEMTAMPFIPLDQYRPLPELVDFALSHGFRLLALAETTVDEWDEFENRHCLVWEDWLRDNPDSPDFDEVRERADRHRRARVHGQRETVGLAYLTLLRT